MNNKDFIVALAKKSGYAQDFTQQLVRSLTDMMGRDLENNESILFSNFGTFEVRKHLERVIVNPATNKKMLVPPKLVLNFKPVSSIKDELKKGGDDEKAL